MYVFCNDYYNQIKLFSKRELELTPNKKIFFQGEIIVETPRLLQLTRADCVRLKEGPC